MRLAACGLRPATHRKASGPGLRAQGTRSPSCCTARQCRVRANAPPGVPGQRLTSTWAHLPRPGTRAGRSSRGDFLPATVYFPSDSCTPPVTPTGCVQHHPSVADGTTQHRHARWVPSCQGCVPPLHPQNGGGARPRFPHRRGPSPVPRGRQSRSRVCLGDSGWPSPRLRWGVCGTLRFRKSRSAHMPVRRW